MLGGPCRKPFLAPDNLFLRQEQCAPFLPNGAQSHHVVSLRLWLSFMGLISSEQFWCRRL